MIGDPQYKVGMAQILVMGGKPVENLERAAVAIARAAAAGCRLVVLPECLDLGWTDPATRELAQPIPGPHVERLSELAKAHRIYVAAGLAERRDDRFYNAAVLLAPDGQLILHHRKINELDIALNLYAVGDRLGVVETELGVLGLNICADNFPDSLAIGDVLARMGAQVILSPSAWAVEASHDQRQEPYGRLWRDAYGTLARRYGLTIIGVSNVGWIGGGPWRGRKCIGCSLAVGPTGEKLAEGSYGEQAEALICVDVVPRPPIARGAQFAAALEQRERLGL